MITRVPVSISMGTRGTRELLMSLLVEALPLSPFCSEIFQTFSLSYWGANSYYPRGSWELRLQLSSPVLDYLEISDPLRKKPAASTCASVVIFALS